MVSLSQTHNAIIELLELMRCDNCTSTLHQPFTTGVCEHLLCSSCIPSRGNVKIASCCPVCSVPVHARDFQVHPQFTSLVLVARRLKKLTMSTSQEETKDPRDLVAENNIPDTSKNETAMPQVVIKRAYSSASKQKQSEDKDSKRSIGIRYKRGHSLVDSNINISTVSTSVSNVDSTDNDSCINYKPHYPSKDKIKANKKQQPNKVTKLLAYPSSDTHQTISSNSVNGNELYVSLDKSIESLPIGNVVVHNTRNARSKIVSKGGNDKIGSQQVMPSKISVPFPFASPEPSRVTDQSTLSPSDPISFKTSVFLTHVDLPITNKSKIARSKSSSISKKNSKGAQNNVKKVVPVQDRKSSGFLNLVHKLRPNSKGESQLHRAAIRGDTNQTEELLAAGLSPNVRDHAGWTPLHEAALRGHCEVAKVLIKAGATVDIPGGPELETPLHEAIQNGQVNFCQLLLDHGANPLFPNNNGIIPIQLVDNSICQLKELQNSDSKPSKYNFSLNALSDIREMLNKASLSTVVSNKNCLTNNQTSNILSVSTATTFIERRRLRPILLGTGLTRTQQSLFSRVATMIHARVFSSISPEVTHVVTGALQELPSDVTEESVDNNTKKNNKSKRNSRSRKNDNELLSSNGQATCPRTLKFLSAVLQGCWILSFDWIETCAHIKMRVEEEGFEVTGCSTAPMSGAPRRARLAHEAGSLGLFHGLRICFLGNFVYPVPSRDELTRLARSGGASVVFSRDVCSPVRLARYAVESPNNSSIWDLNTVEANKESDQEANENISFIDEITMIDSNNPSSLLVFYDPGVYNKTKNESSSKSIYAVEAVTKALNLIKPKKSANTLNSLPNDLPPPLQSVPCTWLLDCAAEYRLLPFPKC
ncbi:unnamed protein product [Schistosoma turkestanicum]|nr:unnamed protein product [Schistosoma turkestanicum]